MPLYNIFSRKKEKARLENKKAAKIFIDNREKNSLVPAILSKLNIEYEFAHLPTGDYVINDVVIEIKTIPDLKSSIINKRQSGGTTVAASIFIAQAVGINVFATGGIGGVHRDSDFDISMDLLQLSQTPMVVVCAGAKAILDIPATLEYLETHGVPVIGFRTQEFPAFYSRHSGLSTSASAETPSDIAQLASTHWRLGLKSSILVAVPIPEQDEIPFEEIQMVIDQALGEAKEAGIHGQQVTPFLLSRVSELSDKKSLRANLALLKNNASIAAQIACAFKHP
jgi:pseudouridine-5'-phosphate glycosidase